MAHSAEPVTETFYILVGPSGVGKDAILKIVLEKTGRRQTRSLTTRPRRDSDTGEKYEHVDDAAFEAADAAGQLVERAPFNGYWYGAQYPKPGEILIVEIQGAQQILAKVPHARMILVVPPGNTLQEQLAELTLRQIERDGQADDGRLAAAPGELEIGLKLAHCIVVSETGKQEQAASQVITFIEDQ